MVACLAAPARADDGPPVRTYKPRIVTIAAGQPGVVRDGDRLVLRREFKLRRGQHLDFQFRMKGASTSIRLEGPAVRRIASSQVSAAGPVRTYEARYLANQNGTYTLVMSVPIGRQARIGYRGALHDGKPDYDHSDIVGTWTVHHEKTAVSLLAALGGLTQAAEREVAAEMKKRGVTNTSAYEFMVAEMGKALQQKMRLRLEFHADGTFLHDQLQGPMHVETRGTWKLVNGQLVVDVATSKVYEAATNKLLGETPTRVRRRVYDIERGRLLRDAPFPSAGTDITINFVRG